MIAGDANRRNFSIQGHDAKAAEPGKALWAQLGQVSQESLEQRAIGFNCLNYMKNEPEPSLYRHYIPDKAHMDAECPEGLRLEIMFPSCWNGKDLDSPNHRSHMAYPDQVMSGGCPEGFPVKTPGLFYETIWDTYAFASSAGRFVISNGDIDGMWGCSSEVARECNNANRLPGYSYHADFMTGWKEDFFQMVLNDCTDLSGEIKDCPYFTIQEEKDYKQCTIKKVPSILANEKVAGKIGSSLPGGVKIITGPEPLNATNPNTKPYTNTLQAPSVGYTPGASPTYSNPIPGQVFHLSDEVASPMAVTAITSSPELPVKADGVEVVRTKYITESNIVKMVIVKEKIEYITETTTTYISTEMLQPTPKRARLQGSTPRGC